LSPGCESVREEDPRTRYLNPSVDEGGFHRAGTSIRRVRVPREDARVRRLRISIGANPRGTAISLRVVSNFQTDGEVGPRDGSHGPRRLVSDGTPSEKGVRSVWTRPTTERPEHGQHPAQDRKSTRLNSSHVAISYAVFCLKKKNKKE